jgi:hypothetical protein
VVPGFTERKERDGKKEREHALLLFIFRGTRGVKTDI